MNIFPLINIADVIEFDSSSYCENVQLNASSSNSSFPSIYLASIQTHFITSTGNNSLQLINTSTSSPLISSSSSSSNNKTLESHKKITNLLAVFNFSYS
ncbi:unnamed protein product [Rotaria sordida]|uniref:Uncharacterized protein n=1 Tax=Rotaria sordida TaxID=392033 RepID=A0A818K7V1_9BILA|nr:unnamed protein product [Rotaria sordida]CAF3551105.1 unnamed protein product [Rotaria sordida]